MLPKFAGTEDAREAGIEVGADGLGRILTKFSDGHMSITRVP